MSISKRVMRIVDSLQGGYDQGAISDEALTIIEAVLAGRVSKGVNRPRIAGLFEAAKVYTVYTDLPEDMCDLCFGGGKLRDNKVCHRCNGTGKAKEE